MNSHLIFVLSLGLLSLGEITAAEPATFTVLSSLPGNSYPYGRLETDSKGALYGTSHLDPYGAIYRLQRKRDGWLYTTLLYFGGKKGEIPPSGLVEDDTTGIFYGVTAAGGSLGKGTVYAFAPSRHKGSETVLHSFTGQDDGYQPVPLLLKDKTTGDLYGTAENGGAYGCGTAFQVAQVNGIWTFTTLYAFRGGNDVCNPSTQLKPGAGTGTLVGASNAGNGMLFQLKQSGGAWSDAVIYRFTGGADGSGPADIDSSKAGIIYGVASSGGKYRNGVVFQIAPEKKKWIYSVIYDFQDAPDGSLPVSINFDATTGHLYGTTLGGGATGYGTVFRLSRDGASWKETVLHSFSPSDGGGYFPESRPVIDASTGALYGTALVGGQYNGGTVYEIQP